MLPDEPTDEERLEELAQDNQTPFNIADEVQQSDDTHPATDSGVEPGEQYEAGINEASGMSEPNAESAVVDYTPPESNEDENE